MIEGYTNLLIKNPTVEEKFKAKKAICDECPHGVNGKICKSTATTISDITGQEVPSYGGCSCPLMAHLRSSKPCPKGNF